MSAANFSAAIAQSPSFSRCTARSNSNFHGAPSGAGLIPDSSFKSSGKSMFLLDIGKHRQRALIAAAAQPELEDKQRPAGMRYPVARHR